MTTIRAWLVTANLSLTMLGGIAAADPAARRAIPIRVTVKHDYNKPGSGGYIIPLTSGKEYQRDAVQRALEDKARHIQRLVGAKRYELEITGATSAQTRDGLHAYRLVDQVTAKVHLHDD